MGDADAELAAAVRDGRRSAEEVLAALYWRHAERVWHYARYFSGSDEAAAEIVQESFLRLARNLAKFEGRARFSTWLYAIVRSVAIDVTTRLRKTRVTVEEDAMARLPAKGEEPLHELIGGETRAAVREAVGKLPENEREAVVMCELQDLSLKEACEILGWSESRLKVTLYRARRRLRALLGSYVGAETSF